MRLLVSVRNAAEAAAALAGGADIVDAKEPLNGAMGPVSPGVLASIASVVGGDAPISAALGDIGRDDISGGACAAAAAGAAFAKLGFAGARRRRRIADDVLAIAAIIGPAHLVLVAYADYERADAPSPEELIALACDTNAVGILIDTYDKSDGSLMALMPGSALQTWVTRAKSAGRIVALAGRLTDQDIERVHEAGADIVGVRGAACDGGRDGIVTADRVHALRSRIDHAAKATIRSIA